MDSGHAAGGPQNLVASRLHDHIGSVAVQDLEKGPAGRFRTGAVEKFSSAHAPLLLGSAFARRFERKDLRTPDAANSTSTCPAAVHRTPGEDTHSR